MPKAKTKITEITTWSHATHRWLSICPNCDADLLEAGITKLLYEFRSCDCGAPDFEHLVEQLWHRNCFRRSEEDA